MAVPVCMPINSIRGFLFLCTLSSIVCRLFESSHSNWHEIVPHCGFDLHLSNNEQCEHLFMCLLAICMLLWRNVCLGLFPIFWLGCLFSWYWVVWAAYIFWKLILCQLFHFYYFLPFWGLSFHLAYSFLWCVKAFRFNQVPLVYFCFYFDYSRRWLLEGLAFLIYVIECSAYVFL